MSAAAATHHARVGIYIYAMTPVSGSTGRATISKSLFVLLSYILYPYYIILVLEVYGLLFFFIPSLDLCESTRPRKRDITSASEGEVHLHNSRIKMQSFWYTDYWSVESLTLVRYIYCMHRALLKLEK